MARLFRKSFLERVHQEGNDLIFAPPERQLALFWPTLLILTFGLTAISTWFFFATVPIRIEARGVAMPLGGVREVHAFNPGIVSGQPNILNDTQKAGDILLKINSPIASATYMDDKFKFAAQRHLLETKIATVRQKFEQDSRELTARIDAAQAELRHLKKISVSLKLAIADHKASQDLIIKKQVDAERGIRDLFTELGEAEAELLQKGLLSRTDFINFKQQEVGALKSLSVIERDVTSSRVEHQQLNRELTDLVSQIETIEISLQSLENERHRLESEKNISLEELYLQGIELENALRDSERKLWFIENMVFPYDGQLIAMRKGPGQLISQGETVALMSLVPQQRKLLLVISEHAAAGSLVFSYSSETVRVDFTKNPMMFAEALQQALQGLTKTGSIQVKFQGNRFVVSDTQGKVSVDAIKLGATDMFDAEDVPVFATLVPIGDNWSDNELRAVIFLRLDEGKRVSVGDYALFRPGSEKTLIGTRIHARVEHIGNYAMTPIEAQAHIGSAELVGVLSGDSPVVMAILKFDRNEDGALRLKGNGLNRPLEAGGVGQAHIEIDKVSPFEILIPFYANLME